MGEVTPNMALFVPSQGDTKAESRHPPPVLCPTKDLPRGPGRSAHREGGRCGQHPCR